MSNIIIETQEDKEKLKKLLAKDIPSYRQAYSDRTSMIMACLSELVYLKFNKPLLDKTNKKLIENVTKLLDEKKASSVYKLMDLLAYDSDEEKEKLISELSLLNFKLEKIFDKKGTQAMVISSDRFYALVFRGTEPTSISDIKADLDAKQTEYETGGKIHRGFQNAFDEVYEDIQNYLDKKLQDKPLFITGHSLGGALATVATKKLKHPALAACYTYGSPRVGNEEWILGIKTPIYRLVNSADPVTMLPPGSDTIDLMTFLAKFIPRFGDMISNKLESDYGGYTHAGYMRYLTNIEAGKYKEVKLLYSVSFLRRTKAYLFKSLSLKSIPADHSISVYRRKLQNVAFDRQNIK